MYISEFSDKKLNAYGFDKILEKVKISDDLEFTIDDETISALVEVFRKFPAMRRCMEEKPDKGFTLVHNISVLALYNEKFNPKNIMFFGKDIERFMVIFRDSEINEKIIFPEKFWNFTADFYKGYEDFYNASIDKGAPEGYIIEKMDKLFIKKVEEICQS